MPVYKCSRELVVVEVPGWVQEMAGDPNLQYWVLHKCLPGQRNAALRWKEHITEVCQTYGFMSYEGSAVYKHVKAYVSIHIDDIIVISDAEFIEEFTGNLKEHFKLKLDGPHGQSQAGALYYLKRHRCG